jgi:hypothetical protein
MDVDMLGFRAHHYLARVFKEWKILFWIMERYERDLTRSSVLCLTSLAHLTSCLSTTSAH